MNYSFVQVFLDCCHRWTRTVPLEKGKTLLVCPHATWLVTISPERHETEAAFKVQSIYMDEAPEKTKEKP